MCVKISIDETHILIRHTIDIVLRFMSGALVLRIQSTYYKPCVVRHLRLVNGELRDKTSESLLIIGGEMPLGQLPKRSQCRS